MIVEDPCGRSLYVDKFRQSSFDAGAHRCGIPTEHHKVEIEDLMEFSFAHVARGSAGWINEGFRHCHTIARVLIENAAPLAIDLVDAFAIKEGNIAQKSGAFLFTDIEKI